MKVAHVVRQNRVMNSVLFRMIEKYEGTLIKVFAVLLGLMAWELYAQGQPAYLFPSLFDIYETFLVQVYEDALFVALFNSMQALVLGYGLAVVVGVVLGLSMGLNRYLDVVLNPWVNALYVAPVSALIPLLILVGGASFQTRVMIVFLLCIFEIIVNTYEGVKTIPQNLVDVVRSFDASRLYVIKNVIIPHDLPYIFAGLRLAIGRGVKAMILAELLINFVNLGAMIRTYQEMFRIAGVLSIVILLMVVGIVLTWLMKQMERRVITWESDVKQ